MIAFQWETIQSDSFFISILPKQVTCLQYNLERIASNGSEHAELIDQMNNDYSHFYSHSSTYHLSVVLLPVLSIKV